MNKAYKVTASLLLLAAPLTTNAAMLSNPLGSISDPQALAIRILQILLGFVSIIGLIMFIFGGFSMLTSGGNADKIKKAKDTLVWAAAGIAVILGSYTFLEFIFKLIQK